jgi:hypothetical protein
VQRDILPIVEGTTVNTKHGMVKTDHILFIAAGAFHVSKPSDLIPELIASKLVKEIALFGGDIAPFVSPEVRDLVEARVTTLGRRGDF